MVLRGKPVGEQDVADQRRAFLPPGGMPWAYHPRECVGFVEGPGQAPRAAPGEYIYSSRGAVPRGEP